MRYVKAFGIVFALVLYLCLPLVFYFGFHVHVVICVGCVGFLIGLATVLLIFIADLVSKRTRIRLVSRDSWAYTGLYISLLMLIIGFLWGIGTPHKL